VLRMIRGGATHIAVATDHVIKSFRAADRIAPGGKQELAVPFGMSEFICQVVASSTKADVEATWNAATPVLL
jgi:hypothetical protein